MTSLKKIPEIVTGLSVEKKVMSVKVISSHFLIYHIRYGYSKSCSY